MAGSTPRAASSAAPGHRRWTAQPSPPKDAKTALQEWAQARGLKLPAYVLESRAGPSHAPVFVISVTVAGQSAAGTAGSKRRAEQLAAEALLASLAPGAGP